MENSQIAILAILVAAVALFIWGRPRYDVVAILALLATAIAGLVPAQEVFLGFGHPAVITVIAVLVISRGLHSAGVVDTIAGWLSPLNERPEVHLEVLITAAAVSLIMWIWM